MNKSYLLTSCLVSIAILAPTQVLANNEKQLGLVKVLANAATTDPQLKDQINTTNRDDREIAQAYYKKLFFPGQSLNFFKKIGGYLDFKQRKSNCTSVSSCNGYYSFKNLESALLSMSKDKRANYNGETIRAKIKEFGTFGDSLSQKRQVAAFFANAGQETYGGTPGTAGGAPYSFTTVTEGNCYETKCQQYGVVDGNYYYGRGPKQLTYPANYKFYSKTIFDDYRLFNNPNKLVSKGNNPGENGWKTAIAYMLLRYNDSCQYDNESAQCGWQYKPKYFSKPTMLEGLIHDKWTNIKTYQGGEKKAISKGYGPAGFGQTVNIINGGVECKDDAVRVNTLNRINNYVELLIRFDAQIKKVQLEYKDGSINDIVYQKLKNNMLNKNQNGNKPKVTFSWGAPAYNTQPLPLKLYPEGKPQPGDPTDVKKIKMFYKNNTHERLDCTGYKSF
jgi:hypothetical protein